jgi:hypothetical protein
MELACKQRNITNSMWCKENIANIMTNRGKNTCFSILLKDRKAHSFSIAVAGFARD